MKLFKLFISLLIIVAANSLAFGQKVIIKPFTVQPSTLLEDLRALKTANPKMSADELVKNANALLQQKGINYSFGFDESVCRQVRELRAKQKDPNFPVNLNAKLNSFEGDTTVLTLPSVRFSAAGNGKCYSLLPLFEIAQNDFITMVENNRVKFNRPPNFAFSTIALVDNQTMKTVLKSWKVPFCGAPLSVSADGKRLFLDVPGGEFTDLTFIAYDEGTFQFYAKKDVDLEEKAVSRVPAENAVAAPGNSFVAFGSGERQRTVRYAASCE